MPPAGVRDAVISGLRSRKRPLRSGASPPRSTSVGLSSRAAGRSWLISGLALWANRSSRTSVRWASLSNVGSATKVAASSLSRRAVVRKTRLEDSIRERNWPSRSVNAAKTSPVLLTKRCTTAFCWLRIRSTRSVSWEKGASVPSASETSAPRPPIDLDWDCIHVWKASRVGVSNARKISSSSTVGDTREAARRPPSRIFFAPGVPGVSST